MLQMSDIAKRFGATQALRGVSLDVQAGEVVALIGENGAGKSTLMKVLAGAHRPDSGSMTLRGASYHPTGPHDARRAGAVFVSRGRHALGPFADHTGVGRASASALDHITRRSQSCAEHRFFLRSP